MKALILAAGFGKRLEPYSAHTPKPLFTLSNQPLLDRIIRKLSSSGISSIMVNTHHLHHRIEQYLASQSYPVPVGIRYEPTILGTGGAIKNLSDFWDDDPFMVVNSDILFDTDLEAFRRYHFEGCPLATLMLCDHEMFNQVIVGPDDRIFGFDPDALRLVSKMKALAFTGIQIVHPELLDFIPANRFTSIIDAYKAALGKNKHLRAFIPDRLDWTDIGLPERYREAAFRTMAREAFFRSTGQNNDPNIHRQKLAGDGSDRLWYRITAAGDSIILVDHGIRTGPETEEVDSFIRIGRHLSAQSVAVPAIILADPFSGLVFLEDLGDLHLQEVVLQIKADTGAILTLYRSVIDELIHMAFEGKKGFDPQWAWQTARYDHEVVLEKECRYFVEAFLNRYLGMDASYSMFEDAFEFLAEGVAACTDIGFMHRDMQSRNIMVRQGRCAIIDFQGGRMGPLQYDLASLLLDPYVALSPETVSALYRYYVNRLPSGINFHETAFREGFETCCITRNLQILGAFSYLTVEKGKPFFEKYIPVALQTLATNLHACHGRDRLTGLRKFVQEAQESLYRKP